jgi:hypothetical protein
MTTDLKEYLYTSYPKLFTCNVPIICEDGWFPLILCTVRFLQTYHDQQNSESVKNPMQYETVLQPEILKISKNHEGFLDIDIKNTTDHITSFVKFISYMSGNVCEMSSSLYNNVYVKNDVNTFQIINEKYITNNMQLLYYIDNEKLRNLLKRKKFTDQQLEFKF